MRALRLALVLVLATSILVVIPGDVSATVPGDIGRIAFTSDADDADGEIYVRDFAGSSPVRLTNNSYGEYAPMWSPDSTQIAFTRDWKTTPFSSDLFVMDVDGSNAVNLTNGVGSLNLMGDWSPDGFWILFISNRSGSLALWKMHPDGSNPQMVFNDAGPESGAAWSPDGSRIAFSRLSGTTSLDIWVVNADGTGATQLTSQVAPEAQPAWSPDGSRIAYILSAGPYGDIWAMNADGSNPVKLTNNSAPVFVSFPAWAPDGTKIAYVSDLDGDDDIWMMNPDGSGQTHLTNNPADESSISWEQVNRLPNAVNDSVNVSRGGSVVVAPLSNDWEPDGEDMELYDITRMPTEGTVVINAGGTVTYTHDGRTASSYLYSDSFEYEVQDSRLGWARADVTVWIYPAFNDVPDSNVFVDDIIWLAIQGITKGCNPPDNTLFCPSNPVTRGQMAAFLVRARGYTDNGGGNLFVDDNGSIFEGDIDRLGAAGVTRGCNPPVNDRFCPNSYVTRGQMAAFLVRAYGLSGGASDLFVDDNGSIFEDAINTLGATGVSKGCNPPVNDRFCPDDLVTREQMAAFMKRAAALP